MSLRCLFLVQGEGRGHLTQALSLRHLLHEAGHSVVGTVVGTSPSRAAPSFFADAFDAPVSSVDSPSFVPDADDRAVRPWVSLVHELGRTSAFVRSLEALDAAVERHAPDVIVNFFDPLGGLYAWGYRPAVPIVAVAHQYMFHHPAYSFPPGRWVQRWGAKAFAHLTAAGASRRLALSLYPVPSAEGLSVHPPLLRPKLFQQAQRHAGTTEPFLLVYLLNSGYAEEVIQWHEQNPDVRLRCFWDRPDAAPVEAYDDTLTFYQLDDDRFLAFMARCRGFVSTAGFESVAEALYLETPVQVVPVEGHFEQLCNAFDTVRARAGIWSTRFDLDRLRAFLPDYPGDSARFRRWIRRARPRIVREIEAVVARAGAPAATARAIEPVQ